MPGTAVNLGTGTTVTFATSGFTAEITDVQPYNLTIQTFDTTHMLTTQPSRSGSTSLQQGGRTYVASKFGDPGQLRVTMHFNPQQALPSSGVFENATVTAPLVPGDTTAAKWVGSACLIDTSPTIPHDGLMMTTCTWKWSGIVTQTLAT